jgi:hypothetical protein
MGSKIWLYQTNRAVESAEQEMLQNLLEEFAQQWMAHGKSLQAKFWFHNPFLLVCEVDESLWGASGCSIDSKVRFLKELGSRYDIDFFVRMKTIARLSSGSYQQLDFNEIKNHLSLDAVFNPSVARSEDMNRLFTSVSASPMQRLFV